MPAARRAADAFAQQVLLADDADPAGDEAALQPQRDHGGRVDGQGLRGLPVIGLLGLEAVFVQEVRQALAGAAGPGGHDRAPPLPCPGRGLLAQLLEHVLTGRGAGLGEHVAGAAAGIEAGGSVRTAIRAEQHHRPLG